MNLADFFGHPWSAPSHFLVKVRDGYLTFVFFHQHAALTRCGKLLSIHFNKKLTLSI
jgi:hypothetical protein